MRRQILFVFGTQACIPGDPLLAAKRLDCRTAVLGLHMPCGMPVELVDHFEKADLRRPDEVLAAARALHNAYPIHGVIGYDDQAVPIVARIAADLGLPGHPVEAADAARDKALMKQHFKATGIPIAPYTLAADEDDAVQWVKRTSYPVVVKPIRGSASQAVIRADNEPELRHAYRRVCRIVRDYGLDIGSQSDTEQLVETYIDGFEFSVEVLVERGVPHVVCVFEKPQPLCGPFFEETIYVTPPRLSKDWHQEIRNLATRAVSALGLRDGAAHCEIRLSSQGPFVLELGARIIGGACSRIFRYVLGEDIHPYLLGLALGDPLSVPQQRHTAAGAMMLPIPKEGCLLAVRGVDHASQVCGIQDVIITASPGDLIVPFPEQSCYIGFLTAAADSPEAVTDALASAAALIELDLAPVECERWTRQIHDHQSFQLSPEHRIRSLDNYMLEEARNIVFPIVAAAEFGEEPSPIAMAKAHECLDLLEQGDWGETSPSVWLVAEDYGVALGSVKGATCYLPCLSVVPNSPKSGLGEALVHSIMALFARQGCQKIEVLVDPRRPTSMDLYRRLGFTPEPSNGQICSAC